MMLENTLDRKDLKIKLLNFTNTLSDTQRLYQIKHGVFDLEEFCKYLGDLEDKKMTKKQK